MSTPRKLVQIVSCHLTAAVDPVQNRRKAPRKIHGGKNGPVREESMGASRNAIVDPNDLTCIVNFMRKGGRCPWNINVVKQPAAKNKTMRHRTTETTELSSVIAHHRA